jgi:two-component system nitrogen regulation response regulator GlnG
VSAPPPTILIVDDDPDARNLLVELCLAEGATVLEAETGAAALEALARATPTLVLLDIGLPDIDGLEVLRRITTAWPGLPVVMVTGTDDVRTVVEAMRLGAHDFVPKPFANEQVRLPVRRALERQALLGEVERLREEVASGEVLGALTGLGAEMREVVARIKQVAGSPLTVLVQGETGTGKEIVARAIHQDSPRRTRPFLAVDCGALPENLIESELFGYERGAFTGADRRKEGFFQLAHGGTLLLDEVANLALATQGKLLRVLQERQVSPLGGRGPLGVDVRVIAACNVPLEDEVLAGRFRQDLFYRLDEFRITLPPLRARRGDILVLARRFLDEASVEMKRHVRGFTVEAEAWLLQHAWPGNVRELRNVVRRAVLLAQDLVAPEHLETTPGATAGPAAAEPAPAGAPASTLKEARARGAAEAERQAIRGALTAARGNKSEAARLLKTDFKTLHLKMRQYGIVLTERRPG